MKRAPLFFIKALWAAFVVLTPLFGAWFASSLAAYANRSTWLTAFAGLLLFPVLPGAWEAFAQFRQRNDKSRRFLTLGDRLLLRTLAINVLFLGVLLGTRPAAAVRAVSARGDWMLDGHDGTAARGARRVLLGVADSFDWLYRLAHESAAEGDEPERKKGDDPPLPRGDTFDLSGDGTPVPPEVTAPKAKPFDPARPWPSDPDIDPRVRSVPPASEATIPLLAAYLVGLESDPYRRFKLLHDWVADHVAYDFPALDDGTYVTKQRALPRARVTRRRVCGLCRLAHGLGKAAGYVIDFVPGVAKGASGEVDGSGHAWNVVVIEQKKWLVDATWDAGHAKPGSTEHDHFRKDYRTDYLFLRRRCSRADHFPKTRSGSCATRPSHAGSSCASPSWSRASSGTGGSSCRPIARRSRCEARRWRPSRTARALPPRIPDAARREASPSAATSIRGAPR